MKKNTKNRIYTSLFLILLFGLITKYNFILIYTLIIFGIFSILEIINISRKIFNITFFKYIFNLFIIIYISLFCYLFLIFSSFLQLKFILYTLLLGCIASDIGGFLIGKLLKGPKITKISPNKTYSGAIGSIFFTFVILSTSFYFFVNQFNYLILILSLTTSVGCQLGDLFFSYLKRKAKIKDTGNILPGHGGILDRIDGILFGIPVGLITIRLLF